MRQVLSHWAKFPAQILNSLPAEAVSESVPHLRGQHREVLSTCPPVEPVSAQLLGPKGIRRKSHMTLDPGPHLCLCSSEASWRYRFCTPLHSL